MSNKITKKSNDMWGGRFEAAPANFMTQINASIDVDYRLWRQDIMGSQAHCKMLIKQEIITAEDGKAILDGLDLIAGEIETGSFDFQ